MGFVVVMTSSTGYVFRNFFEQLEEAREFVKNASSVLLPGETVQLFQGIKD